MDELREEDAISYFNFMTMEASIFYEVLQKSLSKNETIIRQEDHDCPIAHLSTKQHRLTMKTNTK